MNNPDPYYFDYSASEPPFEEALEAFVTFSKDYPANPSSMHAAGKEAGRTLLELKMRFCDLLGLKDGHLLLCASATEANNTVIEGHRKRFPEGRIWMAEDVHDSLWYATKKHRDHTDLLSVNLLENPSQEQLERALKPGTTLICLNHVCNETGRIQQLAPIARFCEVRGIRLLVDGSQAVGHIPVNLEMIPCDYYHFSAHKFGGPRGVGGILLRDRQFESLLSGGKQEWELRAGTENLAGLAAALKSLELSLTGLEKQTARLNSLKSILLSGLKNQIPGFLENSRFNGRPGFISVSFPGFMGNEIVTALSLSGFKIATGSACHADRPEPSRIIMATGRNEKEALGTIRISMGRGNSEEMANQLGKKLAAFILN